MPHPDVPGPRLRLHALDAAHLPELVDLWVESWAATLPEIDFEARRSWLVDHLNALALDGAAIVCAFAEDGAMQGFFTLDRETGVLDQFVVRRAAQGTGVAKALLDAAKARAAGAITLRVNLDNPRAIRFYEREGFVGFEEDVNPRSGLPVLAMRWSG